MKGKIQNIPFKPFFRIPPSNRLEKLKEGKFLTHRIFLRMSE